MEIEIHQADIFEVEAEAMVYPGTANGALGDERGHRLLKLVGTELALETQDASPIAVGAAMVVEVNGLKVDYVIYSPLVLEPGEKIIVENVRRCTRAALVAMVAKELESLVLPAILPNSDDMSVAETSRAIVDEIRGFRADHDFAVTVVDTDPLVVESLNRAIDTVR
jgi:O-acetyl-ADP-ribose deacetylase (regulator of RNase III)